MNATDLYYNFPDAAYLLFFIVVFLILFWVLYQYRLRVLFQYTSQEKLAELLIPQKRGLYWIRFAGFCLAWICLCLSLMQPKGNARYPPELKSRQQNVNVMRLQPHEVIFLIDASASMTVPDGRLGQTRFENAKDIADQTMGRLQGQSGSLSAFTSEVSKLSPPSMDYLFMRLMLRNMAINEGDATGTDFKKALQYIQDNYLKQPSSLIKTLVIISDGGDDRLEELKGSERDKYMQDIAALLGNPENEKLHVYTIGVGTKKGGEIPKVIYGGKIATSHLDEDLLKVLSSKGGGRYYSGNDYAAVDIAADLAAQIAKADVFAPVDLTAGLNPNEDLIYDLYFQFPLGLAILILALCLFWPETNVLKQKILSRAMWAALFFLSMQGTVECAESRDEQLHLGAAYFAAEDYPEAIRVFQGLLDQNLSGWERSIVAYNLGTVFAVQGNEEKAIETLQMIPIDNDTSPLLVYRLRSNLAAANFRRGKAISRAIQDHAPLTQDPFFKVVYFFKQALQEIPLAQEAECRLYQMIGENSCPKNFNLEEMEALSKAGIAEIRASSRSHLVENAALQQGLPWLATGLQLIGSDIDFLLENSMASSLKSSYKQLFYENAFGWMPLWQALKGKLTGKKNEDALFEKALDDFNRMLASMEAGDFSGAKSQLAASSEGVNHLMRILFAADLFQEVMSKLLSGFSLAALQDPLEANTLLFLQQALNEITLPVEHEAFKPSLDAVKDNLEHSLADVQKGQDLLAQMYFNESWQQIKRILLLLDPRLHDSPEIILEAGLNEQNHALSQMRLLARLSEKQDKIPSTAETFALKSQEYLLLFADLFYDSAYAEQMNEFNAEISQDNKDLRCQYHPWNEVIPLFQQGITLAAKAAKNLKENPLDLNKVMLDQEKILDLWNEALAQLRAPKKSESCHAAPLSTQPSQNGQPPAESFEDIARLIQQMNYEDKRPAAPAAQLKEGLKPW